MCELAPVPVRAAGRVKMSGRNVCPRSVGRSEAVCREDQMSGARDYGEPALRMSREEYHAWAATRRGRFERINGIVVAMVPERVAYNRAKGRGCQQPARDDARGDPQGGRPLRGIHGRAVRAGRRQRLRAGLHRALWLSAFAGRCPGSN